MEVQDDSRNIRKRPGRKSYFGLFIIFLGAWWLLHRVEPTLVPEWVLTWPVLLIVLGFVNLLSNGFRNFGGYVLMLVGAAFLAHQQLDFPVDVERYLWPVIVIFIGIILLLKPKKKCRPKWGRRYERGKKIEDVDFDEVDVDSSDKLDTLAVFSAVTKDVISKDFKGGDITAVLGGIEINFANADISGKAGEIDLTIVMGGVKLIVPRHWDVKINTTNIAGGVEDKRQYFAADTAEHKHLTINGTIIMGGVEITTI